MLLPLVVCCSPDSESGATPASDRLLAEVREELDGSSGEDRRLIRGLTFGMTPAELSDHCRARNQAGEFRNGFGFAVAIVPDSTHPQPDLRSEFYPVADPGGLRHFTGTIAHRQWSPWNRAVVPDSILREAAALLAYELSTGDFRELAGATVPTLYRQDGARLAYVRPTDQQYVDFAVDDLAAVDDLEGYLTDLLAGPAAATYPTDRPQ